MKTKNLIWIGMLMIVLLSGMVNVPVRAQDDGPVLLLDVQFDRNTAGPALDISWSPDGTRLLVADDTFVKVLDAATGEEIHMLHWYVYVLGMPNMWAEWSSDGSQILVRRVNRNYYDRGYYFLWDAATGTLLRDYWYAEFPYLPADAVWTLPHREVMVSDWEGSRSFYGASMPPDADPLTLNVQGEVVTVALSPDGSTLATGVTLRAAYPVLVRFLHKLGLRVDSLPPFEGFMRVDLWDMASGEVVGALSLPSLWHRLVLYWTRDSSGVLIQSAIDFNYGISSQAWRIAAADDDPAWLETGGYNTFTLWDVAADAVPLAVTENYPRAYAAMNPDDTQLVTWARAPQVTLWNVTTGESVHRFVTPGNVSEVWWWPDAPHIVTLDFRPASSDGEAYDVGWRVWDAVTGDLLSEHVFAAPFAFARPSWNAHKTRVAWTYLCHDTQDEDCSPEVMITDFAGNELYRIPTDGWSYLTWNAAGDRLAVVVDGFEPTLRIWALPVAGE